MYLSRFSNLKITRSRSKAKEYFWRVWRRKSLTAKKSPGPENNFYEKMKKKEKKLKCSYVVLNPKLIWLIPCWSDGIFSPSNYRNCLLLLPKIPSGLYMYLLVMLEEKFPSLLYIISLLSLSFKCKIRLTCLLHGFKMSCLLTRLKGSCTLRHPV